MAEAREERIITPLPLGLFFAFLQAVLPDDPP